MDTNDYKALMIGTPWMNEAREATLKTLKASTEDQDIKDFMEKWPQLFAAIFDPVWFFKHRLET